MHYRNRKLTEDKLLLWAWEELADLQSQSRAGDAKGCMVGQNFAFGKTAVT